MTEIVAGHLVYNETTKNANGGTELMARRMVNSLNPELLKEFQIIHSRVRELRPDLKKILVCHDLHNDPEMEKLSDPEYRKNFDKIVFVSNWQAQMFNLTHGIPYSEFVVIRNGIERFEQVKKTNEGPIRLIYHTTPHRGLGILIPVFKHLSKFFDIHLDVFSSFNAYGWPERDQKYLSLFDDIKMLDNAEYHGFQENSVIREYLKKSHIFAYPNIWPETSCLAAIEALASGNIVVHPNFAALPETCEHMSFMYNYTENTNEHANIFARTLGGALQHITSISREEYNSVALSLQTHYNRVYDWENIHVGWTSLLERILLDGKSE